METDIVDLLNRTGCEDPQIMVRASQQLTSWTESEELQNQVYSSVAINVFDIKNDRLTHNGRLVGFIHLKNAMLHGAIWQNIDCAVKADIQSKLFSYLSSGQDDITISNHIECTPVFGGILMCMISQYVKNEWMKGNWSDVFWEKLIEWHAWSSLRAALKAAGSFRLPTRRSAFCKVIKIIFPQLIKYWSHVLGETRAKDLETSIKLTRLLYTCLTVTAPTDKSETIFSSFIELLLTTSFTSIEKLPNKAEHSLLHYRLSKLILAVFMVCSTGDRTKFLNYTLNNVLVLISCRRQCDSSSNTLDRRSVKWLLTLTFSLFSSKAPSYGACMTLDKEGTEQLEAWMSEMHTTTPDGQIINKLAFLASTLLEHWFTLSQYEINGLVIDPEACLSVGGVTSIQQQLTNEMNCPNKYCINALSIWNADEEAHDLIKTDLQSLLGIHSSNRHMLSSSSDCCRQLTELIFTLLINFYKQQTTDLFYQLAQIMHSKLNAPIMFEALCRFTQICLHQFTKDTNWIQLANSLLTDGMQLIGSVLVSINEGQQSSTCTDPALIVASGRIMCLLTRHAVFGIPAGITYHNATLRTQCTDSIQHLIRFIRRPTNWHLIVNNDQLQRELLCLRLSAVCALKWLIEHPLLPDELILPYLESLLNELLILIQDVRESETRIYLLAVLRGLIMFADFITHPQLATPILATLSQLWSIAESSNTLRISILDNICFLVAVLNSTKDSATEYMNFCTALQSPLATIVCTALDEAFNADCNLSLESGLRLWATMVEGVGSMWSPYLVDLMPILVGGGPKSCQPLLSRIDSAEEAELVFRVAQGLLRLAHDAGPSILHSFITSWSDAFWSSLLSVTSHSCHDKSTINLESLYVEAALKDDDQPDSESKYRLYQLELCTLWLTIYLDELTASMNSTLQLDQQQQQQQKPIMISPHCIGLLVLATRACLVDAPIQSHADVCPHTTQLRLGLLARLVIYPNMWSSFLTVLEIVHKLAHLNAPLNLQLIHDCMNRTDQFDLSQLMPLIQSAMGHWLARADCYSTVMQRRSVTIACLVVLKHIAPNYGMTKNMDKQQLGQQINADQVHGQWLEPIISLIIQVLFEADHCAYNNPDPHVQFYNSYPRQLKTRDALQTRVLQELSDWQMHTTAGDQSLIKALFEHHVNGALREQLESQLNY